MSGSTGAWNSVQCRCSCGCVSFTVQGVPLFRVLCHCTICQRFSNAPFADVVIYQSSHVDDPAPDTVDFATYKPPPNVQRGQCSHCGEPVIEKFAVPLLPKLTMVPAAMHVAGTALPDPIAHIFYDRRISEAEDTIQKHSGFAASQLAFARYWLAARRIGRTRRDDP